MGGRGPNHIFRSRSKVGFRRVGSRASNRNGSGRGMQRRDPNVPGSNVSRRGNQKLESSLPGPNVSGRSGQKLGSSVPGQSVSAGGSEIGKQAIQFYRTSKLRYGKTGSHFKRGVKKRREVRNVTNRGDGAIISNALFGMFLVTSVNGRSWSESFISFPE